MDNTLPFRMFFYHNLLHNGYCPPVVKCAECGQRLTGTDAMWYPPLCPNCPDKKIIRDKG